MCSRPVKCVSVKAKTDKHVHIDKFTELCFADEHNASIVQQCFPDHSGKLIGVALDQSTAGLKKKKIRIRCIEYIRNLSSLCKKDLSIKHSYSLTELLTD